MQNRFIREKPKQVLIQLSAMLPKAAKKMTKVREEAADQDKAEASRAEAAKVHKAVTRDKAVPKEVPVLKAAARAALAALKVEASKDRKVESPVRKMMNNC